MQRDEIKELQESITYLTCLLGNIMKRVDSNSNAIDMLWLELKNGIIEIDEE